MNYPLDTPIQVRAMLRALRRARALTQEQAGRLIGVNQRRAAKIEGNPAVTSFGQISRLIAALGGRLVLEVADTPGTPARTNASRRPNKRMPAARAKKPARNTKRSASARLPRSGGDW